MVFPATITVDSTQLPCRVSMGVSKAKGVNHEEKSGEEVPTAV